MASAHEYIAYEADDVGTAEMFDTLIIQATIIQVNRSANTADIYTDEAAYWGRVNGVPIFYHCAGKETVENGHRAFKDEDEVVVLCKNARRKSFIPDMLIVGFPSGPRQCGIECYIKGSVISVVGSQTDTDIRLYISDENFVVQSILTTQSDWVEWSVGTNILAVNMDNCICPKTCSEAVEYYTDGLSLVEKHNITRSDLAVDPLMINRKLAESAATHADWLQSNCRLGHTGEGWTNPADRIIAAGYTESVVAGGEYELGENVGLARSEDEVYSGWLDSSGHYANIIRAGYHEIGIAIRDVSSCDNFYLEGDDTYVDLAATGETWHVYVVNFGRKQPSPWTIIPIELD